MIRLSDATVFQRAMGRRPEGLDEYLDVPGCYFDLRDDGFRVRGVSRGFSARRSAIAWMT